MRSTKDAVGTVGRDWNSVIITEAGKNTRLLFGQKHGDNIFNSVMFYRFPTGYSVVHIGNVKMNNGTPYKMVKDNGFIVPNMSAIEYAIVSFDYDELKSILIWIEKTNETRLFRWLQERLRGHIGFKVDKCRVVAPHGYCDLPVVY